MKTKEIVLLNGRKDSEQEGYLQEHFITKTKEIPKPKATLVKSSTFGNRKFESSTKLVLNNYDKGYESTEYNNHDLNKSFIALEFHS